MTYHEQLQQEASAYDERMKLELLAQFEPGELTYKFEALLNQYFTQQTYIADGCEFRPTTADNLALGFASKEQFELHGHRFLIIGQATHTGSQYALLRPLLSQPVDSWPVLVFGDEGGVLILARNLDDFLRFLTLNAQPYVGMQFHNPPPNRDGDVFELAVEELEDDNVGNAQYAAWLHQTYGLEKISTVAQAHAEIIAPAYAVYQAELDQMIYGDEE